MIYIYIYICMAGDGVAADEGALPVLEPQDVQRPVRIRQFVLNVYVVVRYTHMFVYVYNSIVIHYRYTLYAL